MLQYVPSKFNFWAELGPDEHLLYNGASEALYRLDATEKEATLSHFRQDGPPIEPSLRSALITGGFLVLSATNEIEAIRRRAQLAIERQTTVDLEICPTYECNFRCRYCYVDFCDGRMTPETEERVSRYVGTQLATYRSVRLSWFGGEPLLCADTVIRMSDRFSRIAWTVNGRLAITVLTNGLLLDRETALALHRAGVRYFHVTVDGDELSHDRLRPLRDGSRTRNRIMGNLLEALHALPDMRLNLRINVAQSNLGSVAGLLDEFPRAFRQRIQVDVSPIHERNSECGAPGPRAVRLAPQIHNLIAEAVSRGYKTAISRIPAHKVVFCSADCRANFQIGPDGSLFKCSPWRKPEARVGYIDAAGAPVLNPAFDRWHALDEIPERCTRCAYLCFCGGGCRIGRLRGSSSEGCMAPFEQIDQMIINLYRRRMARQSAEVRH